MSIPVQRITLMIEHVNMLVAIRDEELRVNDRGHNATVASYIALSENDMYRLT